MIEDFSELAKRLGWDFTITQDRERIDVTAVGASWKSFVAGELHIQLELRKDDIDWRYSTRTRPLNEVLAEGVNEMLK